jgi:peptidoglycan endopeptidase LytE
VHIANSELQEGDRGSAISKLQRFLRWHGYTFVTIDGQFGSLTKEAVLDFQRSHYLQATGIVGTKTWVALKEVVVQTPVQDPELYAGVRNYFDVIQLQQLLQWHGYAYITVDGKFGPITKQAVMHFQNEHDLTADGIVSSHTWTALQQGF